MNITVWRRSRTAFSNNNVAPLESGSFEAGLGAEVLGGSALVIHQERWLEGVAANARRTDASWTRVWPTNPYLKQLRLGEVPGTGRVPRQVQGVVVTNSPFVRPALYGTAPLTGAVPPGWDVELYRNSALVGYAAAGPDGRYVFDVPIVYGTNPVELVAHGPTGEVRRSSHTFEVGPERLAARQFEYGIAAGGCWLDPCDGTLNLDAAGLDKLYRGSATVSLTVSNRPPFNIGGLVKGLLDYPYGCLEQTTSAAYPHVFIDEAAAKAYGITRAAAMSARASSKARPVDSSTR